MNTQLQHKNHALKPDMLNGRPKYSVQPKLTVNTPGDIYEQEADAMADRVMRMSTNETVKPVTGLIGKSLQRKCGHCEEEEKKKPIMRKAKAGNSGMAVSSSFAASLNASKGGGSTLPEGTRGFMENAFGADFSGVKIHTGTQASEMSRGINAKAFTHGNEIYFNEGEYSPDTYSGKSLLAHELTHVLQQWDNKTQNLIHRKENILNKKIVKIIAFLGQLQGQAVLSDNSIVPITLGENTIEEPGTYTYFLDAGEQFNYRREDSDKRKGGILWYPKKVYGEKYIERVASEQIVVEILEGDQLSQKASIEALPQHIKNFLTKGEGKTGTYAEIQKVVDAGFVLQVYDVTEDELLLLEVESQKSKGTGDIIDPLFWAIEYTNNRQEKGEESLLNRIEILGQIEVGASLKDHKDQRVWSIIESLSIKGVSEKLIERVVSASGLSFQTIIDTFDFELKSVTETFLSQSLITLLKLERKFITDSVNVGIGQRNLENALGPLKIALELKNRAQSDYAALEFEHNFSKILGRGESTHDRQDTDIATQWAHSKADYEAKSKYLEEVANSVNLPVLKWHGFDLQKLISEKNIRNKQGLLKAFVADARHNIEKAQGLMKDAKNLYGADKMVAITKANLGIKEKTVVNAVIDYHKKLATEDSIWDELLDLASILVIFIPGGIGIALRVGVGLVNAGEESVEFDTKHTMYARGLSSDDPSMLGSVLAIGGVFLDASEMAKGVVKVVGAEVKGATKAEDELLFVEKAAKLEKGEFRIGLDGKLSEVPNTASGRTSNQTDALPAPDATPTTTSEIPFEPMENAGRGYRRNLGLRQVPPSAEYIAARQAFNNVRDGYAVRLNVNDGGQVHHAIELKVIDRYPGVFSVQELNAFENMRGISAENAGRRQLHNSSIRSTYDRHYLEIDAQVIARRLQPGTIEYQNYVRYALEMARNELDYLVGIFFTEITRANR